MSVLKYKEPMGPSIVALVEALLSSGKLALSLHYITLDLYRTEKIKLFLEK